DDKAFVNEVIRLIERPEMPTSGLILDVRGNGGGLIWAGERLLQLFTPRTVEPTRAQFIATAMAVGLCNASAALAPWRESMNRAVETGATYSAAFPITDPARCNDVGQRYYGPVVLLTDARCYSTTDMFTAGFKDHVIGPILGVDDNTGAGGANVWTLDLLRTYLQQAGIANPLQPLPRQAGMRVAIRRTLRVSGAEIEDLGVSPDRVHQPTYADVMQGDVDLLNEACALLAAQTARSLQAAPARNGGDVTVEVTCAGMDRIDAYAGDRPAGSVDVVGGAAHLAFPAPAGAPILLRGFDGAALVACRRFSI
ncbi:MAG: S41 family peptidase, partial [Phenylobacterium sp.]